MYITNVVEMYSEPSSVSKERTGDHAKKIIFQSLLYVLVLGYREITKQQ